MKQALYIGCLFVALSGPAQAARLGDFERDITTPSAGGVEAPSESGNGDDDCWLLMGECMAPPEEEVPRKVELFPREDTYLRLDLRYHNAGQNTVSYDLLAEKAWGKYGVSAKFYQYLETTPSTELDVAAIYMIYRPPASRKFQVDLGVGVGSLAGTQVNSGLSLYLPMHIRFSDTVSLAISPSVIYLANPLLELNGAIEIHGGNLTYVLGHKVLSGPTTRLDGPYIGFAYTWR